MNTQKMKPYGIVVISAISLLILGLFVIPGLMPGVFASDDIGAKQPPIKPNESVKAMNKAFMDVSNVVVEQVVSISVVIENKGNMGDFHKEFREFFKFFGEPDEGNPNEDQSFESEASGSGVIISDNGYIVSNFHVVDKAKEINVTTHDKKVHKAELIGSDPLTDLAVLKIEGDNFRPVHFGNIDELKIGEWVLAVGNPLGLNSTITAGIVSAIGRGGLALLRERGPSAVENFIQTDAAINPGNSGGGLFNLEGSLVGINTAIATRTGSYIGYGFAIPVDLVKSVVIDLIDDGKIDRGQIGVMIRSIDEVQAKSLGLKDVKGVLVNDVMKNSAADKAGIEPGDVILQVDGKVVETSNELQSLIAKRKAGDVVKLAIWRDGKQISKEVKLQARKDDVADNGKTGEEIDNNGSSTIDKLGFSIKGLTDDDKELLDVTNGVMITDVKRNSIAAKRGLAPEGIIVKADKQKINSIKDLKNVFESMKSGGAVMLQVKYKDSYRMIALEIP
jgi:serine protease Do